MRFPCAALCSWTMGLVYYGFPSPSNTWHDTYRFVCCLSTFGGSMQVIMLLLFSFGSAVCAEANNLINMLSLFCSTGCARHECTDINGYLYACVPAFKVCDAYIYNCVFGFVEFGPNSSCHVAGSEQNQTNRPKQRTTTKLDPAAPIEPTSKNELPPRRLQSSRPQTTNYHPDGSNRATQNRTVSAATLPDLF